LVSSPGCTTPLADHWTVPAQVPAPQLVVDDLTAWPDPVLEFPGNRLEVDAVPGANLMAVVTSRAGCHPRNERVPAALFQQGLLSPGLLFGAISGSSS